MAPDTDTQTIVRTALKVLVADDHPLMLQGIRRALEAADDIEVVGEARTGEELLALVERRKPDLVLLDLHMPGMGGLECVTQLKARWPHVKSVVISASEQRASIDAALVAGASAYILKSVSAIDIASVLRQAASGSVYHAPSGTPQLREDAEPPKGPDLTPRETTILLAVADGRTTKTISRDLWLSEHTVKFHLTNIYRKLGVSNRSAAVRYAYEHNLTQPSSPTQAPA
jgi:DNA-binding NarL/FixJ family response regulator